MRLLALVFAALAGREAFAGATQRDLSPTDWSQFRRALNDTRPTGGARLYVLETRLEGHGGEPGGIPFGMFGGSVSLYGDTALVGAPYEGAAYVFVRTGGVWTLQQRLTPPVDAQQFQPELFGTTVSLYGDTAVVGAPYHVPSSGQPGAAFVFVRNGTTWTLQQELLPPDTTQFQNFGQSVSISGDTVVVGAPLATTAAGAFAGAAYMFVRTGTTWTEEQQLLASDGAAQDYFGESVAVDGDTALVGADGHAVAGVRSGSAYVFTRSGTAWTEQQELTASDGAQDDVFGGAVALSGDTAVVGASGEETPGNVNKGAAYVFSRSGTAWSQQQKLEASDGASGDNFGVSVSVSVDTAVIRSAQSASANSAYAFVRSGAVWSEQQKLPMPAEGGEVSAAVFGDTAILGDPAATAPEGYSDTGLAVVFVRSGTAWTQQQLLRSPDDAVLDGVGSSVAASGDSAVVGAPADNTLAGINAGSAYVFVRSGGVWTDQQKLTASDGSVNAGFGSSVSISGDTLVVGAPGDGTPGSQAGAAYVFVRSGTTWSQQQKLSASDATPNMNFGAAVSISGDTLVVGAPGNLSGVSSVMGAAYVFVRSGGSWSQQQKLVPAEVALYDFLGLSASVSGDTVLVGAPNHGGPGAAYVFVRSGAVWTEQQELVAADGQPGELFGRSVSVLADTAVVASRYHAPGTAHVFQRSGTVWTEQQELAAEPPAQSYFGWSVSQSVNVILIGAKSYHFPFGARPAGPPRFPGTPGSVYVFELSGGTWTLQQKLDDPQGNDVGLFGTAVSVSGDIALVGDSGVSTPAGGQSGAVYAYTRLLEADLAVSKTDGQASAAPGAQVTYTIVATNAGPDPAPGSSITDLLPPALSNATWTCVPTGGATCSASGTGSIDDSVTLPVGGTVIYTLTATVDQSAAGTLSNTATASLAAGISDPNPGNESATDTDTLVPSADLRVTKSDGQSHATPGAGITYSIVASNPGPSNAPGVTVSDAFPATISGVTWTCAASGTASCGGGAGSGDINRIVDLPAGTAVTFTASGTIDPGATGTLANTATVTAPAGVTDPEPSDDTATDVDNLTLVGLSELVHGTARVASLQGTGQNVFRLEQEARSSYEIVVDAVTGDVPSPPGTGPLLERLAADASTVLQTAVAAGAGASRSLRFENASATARNDEFVRVASTGCTTGCGPQDVYRIRAWDTTLALSRFNDSGTQITVLVLQNTTGVPVAGHVQFWGPAGALLASVPFTLGPEASLVLDSSGVPGLTGASGSITVSHDAPYGGLAGKAVALEPATGFTFDTLLEPRRH